MCLDVELKKKVDKWNKENPIGTEVHFRVSSEETLTTQTESIAQFAAGHLAGIELAGIEGLQPLDRVFPV